MLLGKSIKLDQFRRSRRSVTRLNDYANPVVSAMRLGGRADRNKPALFQILIG
jgi:hypothetical protein